MNEIIKIEPPEKLRRYYFPENEIIELKNVCEISVSNSGIHRIKTLDGKHHIVPYGWLHIELDIEKWTI